MPESRDGRAEVAGGGIAGLGLGALLARRGWGVRVHERQAGIREVGAGIFLRNNPLRVLEELGVEGDIAGVGLQLERSQWREGDGRLTQDHALTGERRLWMAPREAVIQALHRAATDAGVEVALHSQALRATPAGHLHTADGGDYRGDVVVGADGQGSLIRESLGLTRTRTVMSTVATRFLIPDRVHEPENRTTMYWSGSRRVGVSACSPSQTYVYMIAGEDDPEGVALPIDRISWTRSFPVLGELFETVEGLPGIQHNYVLVKSTHWHKGRAAILGDAAHGLPPLLGQGAGLALSNAWALATELEGCSVDAVPDALAAWETKYRSYADSTQAWSLGLDRITRYWPSPLLPLRSPALNALGRFGPLQKRMRVADGFPIGKQ